MKSHYEPGWVSKYKPDPLKSSLTMKKLFIFIKM